MSEVEIKTGSELAGYRIDSLIGRGGMSVVYLAEHHRLGRKVAFKVLAPELAQEKGFRDRFIRESRLAASIDHPNIIPIYDAGEIDGVLYIAMRYVDGTDLRRRLREREQLPATLVDSVVGQVASALDAAHERGLVHRDVKPANVLLASGVGVDRSEHVYLADFGLTKQALSVSGMTATGQLVGTIDYVAPEQIRGEALDGRADVYSLGCVLFECLTGEPPFKRDAEVATLYAHLQEPAPSVTQSRPDLATGIDEVVSRAMAKSPHDRFPAAGELAAAARAELGTVPEPRTLVVPSQRRRRNVAALVAVAAVVVMLAVAASLLLTRGGGKPQSSPRSSGKAGRALAPSLNSAVQIDPTGRVLQSVSSMPVPCGEPPSLAVGEGAVWYRSCTNVAHVDERGGRLRTIIPVFYGPLGTSPSLVVASRTVWIPSGIGARTPAIARIDPATDEQLGAISLGRYGPVTGFAAEGDTLWAGFGDGRVLRIDSRTGNITHKYSVAGAINDLAVGSGAVWALDQLDGAVYRIDETTGKRVARISVNGGSHRIVAGQQGVWVLDPAVGTVVPIDVQTNSTESPVRVGAGPTSVAEGLGSVWVSDADGILRRIDPVTHRQREIDIGTSLAFVAIDTNSRTIWLAAAPIQHH